MLTATLRAIAALAAIALIPVATPAVARADVELTGEPVTGAATSAEAPPLTPGKWLDTAGGEGSSKFYLVKRSAPGTTLWVSVRFLTPEGYAVLSLTLLTPAGDVTCGSADTVDVADVGDERASVRAGTLASGEDGPCTGGDLVLKIDRAGVSGTVGGEQYQLTVFEEAPALNGATLVGAPEVAWAAPAPGGPDQQLEGSLTLPDAPVVQPGIVRGVVRPGEVRYYKIPVAWGQRLQARVEMPDAAGYPSGYRPLAVKLLNPLGGPASAPKTGAPDAETNSIDGATADFATSSFEVAWANRRNAKAVGSSLAGDYAIGISYGASASSPTAEPRPFVMSVSLVGEAGPNAPEYDSSYRLDTAGLAGGDQGIGARGFLIAGAAFAVVLFFGIGIGALVIALRKPKTARLN